MFFELLSFALVSTAAPTSCADTLSSFQRLYVQSALPERREIIYGNVRAATWRFQNLPRHLRLDGISLKIFEPRSDSEQSFALVERVARGRGRNVFRSIEGGWKTIEPSEASDEPGSVLQFDDMRVFLKPNGQIDDVQLKSKKSWIQLPSTVTASIEEDHIVAMKLSERNDEGKVESFYHILMRASDDRRLSQVQEYGSMYFEDSGIPILIIKSSSPWIWESPEGLDFYRARMGFDRKEGGIRFYSDPKSPFAPLGGHRPVDYKGLNDSLRGGRLP